MKTSSLAVLTAILLAAAPSTQAAPGADKDAQAAVQGATQGRMKPGKGKVNAPECGERVDYEAEAVDLNGDGQLEVLTREYGTCFGMAGVRMNLFIKASDGKWKPQFGFPGEPNILKTRSHGFPDIEIQGPGMCFPVWRYDGKAYQLAKKCR